MEEGYSIRLTRWSRPEEVGLFLRTYPKKDVVRTRIKIALTATIIFAILFTIYRFKKAEEKGMFG